MTSLMSQQNGFLLSKKLIYNAFVYSWQDSLTDVVNLTAAKENLTECSVSNPSKCVYNFGAFSSFDEETQDTIALYMTIRSMFATQSDWKMYVSHDTIYKPLPSCPFHHQLITNYAEVNKDNSMCVCNTTNWCECWNSDIQLSLSNLSYFSQYWPYCASPLSVPSMTHRADGLMMSDEVSYYTSSLNYTTADFLLKSFTTFALNPAFHVLNMWLISPTTTYTLFAVICLLVIFLALTDL